MYVSRVRFVDCCNKNVGKYPALYMGRTKRADDVYHFCIGDFCSFTNNRN